MNKLKKKIIITINLCLLLISTIVYADGGNVIIKTSDKNIKLGEQFVVTISATCNDGINGLSIESLIYDKNVFEIVNSEVVSNNWVDMSGDNEITIMHNSNQTVNESDIYKITFKVRKNANIGETTIKTGKIILNSDAQSNDTINIDSQSIKINVITETNTTENNINKANAIDNTTENNINKTNAIDKITENTNIKVNNANTNIKNDSIANKNIPKTGINKYIPIIVILITIIGGIAFIKYNKYKKI